MATRQGVMICHLGKKPAASFYNTYFSPTPVFASHPTEGYRDASFTRQAWKHHAPVKIMRIN
jgi:hypothetical protein